MDRHVRHEIKSLNTDVDGGERGVFEALVAVFGNVDAYGDRLIKGCFTRTLAEDGLPAIVWAHQWGVPPIGSPLKAEETDDGLVVRGQLYVGDVALADHVYTAMTRKGGDGKAPLRQFSFGYDVREMREVKTDEPEAARFGGYVYELTDLQLHEVGPCLVGVNPATELLEVKGVPSPSAVRKARHTLPPSGAPAPDSPASREAYLTALTGRS